MWSDFYKAGGWGMYPVTLFGFLLLAASLLYTIRPAEKTARLAFVLGGLTFSAGLLGTAMGVCKSAAAIPQVPHDKQVLVLALGFEESMHNLVLALILVVLAGILTAAGMLRRSAGLTSATKAGD